MWNIYYKKIGYHYHLRIYHQGLIGSLTMTTEEFQDFRKMLEETSLFNFREEEQPFPM